MNEVLIPERAVLLHVGPHKTGTTAIQGALEQARPGMADHGVIYPGPSRQHIRQARAITGYQGTPGDPPSRMEHWHDLVNRVTSEPDKRVMVSSEAFAMADDTTAHRVVDEFGRDRVHILVTLRPLAKILPSAWQQYVRSRLKTPYDQWLDAILNHPEENRQTPSFWNRHRHDVLVERWASVVGADRVTVFVVDGMDRRGLMEPFEQMLGLPEGLLQPVSQTTNRSLTAGEVELVRRLNLIFQERGWRPEYYREVIREGAVRRMQRHRTPGPNEPTITTPPWALERAAEIGARMVERIEASGVHVMGDLSILSKPPPSKATTEQLDSTPDEAMLPVEAAVQATFGSVLASTRREKVVTRKARRDAARAVGGSAGPTTKSRTSPRIDELRSTELLTIVGTRVRRRLRRTLSGS